MNEIIDKKLKENFIMRFKCDMGHVYNSIQIVDEPKLKLKWNTNMRYCIDS